MAVFLLCFISDLWLFSRSLRGLLVSPTYCFFTQVACNYIYDCFSAAVHCIKDCMCLFCSV